MQKIRNNIQYANLTHKMCFRNVKNHKICESMYYRAIIENVEKKYGAKQFRLGNSIEL